MEQEQAIELDNWNYCHYATGPLRSMITYGQKPHASEDCAPTMFYWVTVLKNETQEVFQVEFSRLLDAISAINDRYGHWGFVDTSQSSSGGCGSCSNSH